MDIRMAKEMLRQSGERMLDLAEHLDSDGKELSANEKSLIRLAMMPALRERLDWIVLEYLNGHTPDFLGEFEVN